MLANPQVQQQIGMSDAQKQQLERIYDQMRETIEQLQRDTAGKVLNLLTPEQQAALRKQAAAPQPRQ